MILWHIFLHMRGWFYYYMKGVFSRFNIYLDSSTSMHHVKFCVFFEWILETLYCNNNAIIDYFTGFTSIWWSFENYHCFWKSDLTFISLWQFLPQIYHLIGRNLKIFGNIPLFLENWFEQFIFLQALILDSINFLRFDKISWLFEIFLTSG
jgi:hypothetical protein